MGNIVTDRSYQQMAEDMIGEALFPTLASPTYDTFPTSRYPSTTRFQGADDFAWNTWPNGDGMIRWKCMSVGAPVPWSSLHFTVEIGCEIAVAIRGRATAGETSGTPGAHQVAVNDIGKAQEVLIKQLYAYTLTYGEFGIQNTTTIAGQGTSPISCVLDVTCGTPTIEQSLAAGDDDNLGPNAWVATLPVTLIVIVD